jgi:hypothetical protein
MIMKLWRCLGAGMFQALSILAVRFERLVAVAMDLAQPTVDQSVKDIVATGIAIQSNPDNVVQLSTSRSRNDVKQHVSMLKANAFQLAA